MNNSPGLLDPVTWLPNRQLFEDRLERAVALAQRGRSALALLHIDLDRFRDFNDLFGRELGDRVLREAAVRISGACPSGAVLARLGDDEFAVLLKDAELDKAAKLACAVWQRCGEPHVIACVSVAVTTSIGIGLFPLQARDGAALLRAAEQALYRAKTSGRNCIYPLQPACSADAVRPARIERV
jgi:diguanylate cyclase (GGDEF)-like protein